MVFRVVRASCAASRVRRSLETRRARGSEREEERECCREERERTVVVVEEEGEGEEAVAWLLFFVLFFLFLEEGMEFSSVVVGRLSLSLPLSLPQNSHQLDVRELPAQQPFGKLRHEPFDGGDDRLGGRRGPPEALGVGNEERERRRDLVGDFLEKERKVVFVIVFARLVLAAVFFFSAAHREAFFVIISLQEEEVLLAGLLLHCLQFFSFPTAANDERRRRKRKQERNENLRFLSLSLSQQRSSTLTLSHQPTDAAACS